LGSVRLQAPIFSPRPAAPASAALLVVAELEDVVGAQRVVGRDADPDRRVDLGQLGDHQHVLDVAEAGAAELLGEDDRRGSPARPAFFITSSGKRCASSISSTIGPPVGRRIRRRCHSQCGARTGPAGRSALLARRAGARRRHCVRALPGRAAASSGKRRARGRRRRRRLDRRLGRARRGARLRVIRLDRRSGPAAARNAGARAGSRRLPLLPRRRLRDPRLAALAARRASSTRTRPRRAFRLLRRPAGGARRRLALQEPLPPLDAPARCRGGAHLLGRLRRRAAPAFLALGGFDERRYAEPSIEDIELGYRLAERGGRIRLVPGGAGAAPQALDAGLAGAHRRLESGRAVDRAAARAAGARQRAQPRLARSPGRRRRPDATVAGRRARRPLALPVAWVVAATLPPRRSLSPELHSFYALLHRRGGADSRRSARCRSTSSTAVLRGRLAAGAARASRSPPAAAWLSSFRRERERGAPTIAIVGAGPAGLTAAWELARLGRARRSTSATRWSAASRRPSTTRATASISAGIASSPRSARCRRSGARCSATTSSSGRGCRASTTTSASSTIRSSRSTRSPASARSRRCASCASFAQAKLWPHREERNFEQWVSNRFGRRLFEIFFKTYTEKVWGMACTEISADWAAQRIQNLDLRRAVVAALFERRGQQAVKSLIHRFHYPRLGPGMMWERCAERLAARRLADPSRAPSWCASPTATGASPASPCATPRARRRARGRPSDLLDPARARRAAARSAAAARRCSRPPPACATATS
jgi:hypothetical protein